MLYAKVNALYGPLVRNLLGMHNIQWDKFGSTILSRANSMWTYLAHTIFLFIYDALKDA